MTVNTCLQTTKTRYLNREMGYNLRNSYGFRTLGLPTFAAQVRTLIIARTTHMTYVMHSLPGFSKRPLRLGFRRLHVTRESIRILFRFRRVARASLAADMTTRRTLLRARRKHRLAQVTAPAYSLNNLFPNEILSARARGHSQRRRWVARELEMRRHRQGTRLPGANLSDSGAGDPWVLIVACFVGWWEAWAFLASLMLAVYAQLV
jgi:hypothetical protein